MVLILNEAEYIFCKSTKVGLNLMTILVGVFGVSVIGKALCTEKYVLSFPIIFNESIVLLVDAVLIIVLVVSLYPLIITVP